MSKQVFQTQSSTRWLSFVWFVRILAVFLVIGIISVLISLFHKRHYEINLLTYKTRELPTINFESTHVEVSKKEQEAFAEHLRQVRSKNQRLFYNTHQVVPKTLKQYLPMRAGFYVNWDPKSLASLQKNINKLNMVLPEWIFQKDSKGNVEVEVDDETINLLRKNKVAIVPMLSNNFNDVWNGDTTLLVLKNKKSRELLIRNIKEVLDKNKFQGINVDLETLPEAAYPYLLDFSKELFASLHPSGYIVSIDVDPFDNHLDFKEFSPYYDLFFLMAYDEHYPESEPGSISSIKFIEDALDKAMDAVPSEKFIVCLAGYGYDWQKGKTGTDITFQDFISLANEHHAKINFDDTQLDISMRYTGDDGFVHEAHCNDAAGLFNAMRTAEDYNTGGVALWYLGSADDRLWNFYNKQLYIDSLAKHPFNYDVLERFQSMYSADYDGTGEVLEILDEPKPGIAHCTFDTTDQMITGESYLSMPSSYLIKRYGATKAKQIALTFDDGPDEDYTPKILDILKTNKINATFFVTGINTENNIPLIRRIYKEGNEIGNHTFSHPNLEITSEERERIELRSTRLLLESILKHSTILFRPPYNTDAEPVYMTQLRPLAIAEDEGFICVASSIDPNDWVAGITADTIVARAIAQQNLGNVILLHDAGGERSQTVLALPRIIDYFKKQGYEFVTISQLIGKSRDEVMPAVKGRIGYSETLDAAFFIFTSIWEYFLHGFFIIAIFLIIGRLLFVAILAILQRQKEKQQQKKLTLQEYCPKISIIVPAYNEEVNASRTIDNLLLSDYQNFEIIFVDDGSKDNTFQNVKSAFENNEKVRVLTKPNGGKASALNFGIEQASGEILVCIDADTFLKPNAVSLLIPFFSNPKVGAVSGNVKVGNTLNLLTNWQSIEYTTSQNFDRRAFDYLNAILVVPGAIGAFRTSVIKEIEGFTTDTLAEDCDLTVRILKAGYTVRTCNEAHALTEAPETLKMFLKQRFRWSFGMMQSFWKHRDRLFSIKKPNIGWIVLPNLLIYNFIIPLFSPIVDILFIASLFTKYANEYVFFYFVYFFIDCLISYLAYSYDKQKFKPVLILYLFVQRFIYRQLLFYVLLKAYLKAMKGELASWGVLKRTGNVKNS